MSINRPKMDCGGCPHNHEPTYEGSLCESCLTDDMMEPQNPQFKKDKQEEEKCFTV